MDDTLVKTPNLIADFRNKIDSAKENMGTFGEIQDVRSQALIYCLTRAIDLAEGCILVASAERAVSLNTLTRSLLENLMMTSWVALSEENATSFNEAAINELKRITRKNLRQGYATVRDKNTGEERTQEILESPIMKGIPARQRIEDVAEAAGLKLVYNQVYGFLSMHAHGNTKALSIDVDIEQEISASLQAAIVCFNCSHLIVGNWVRQRQNIPSNDIIEMLGF
jgi:hypothetical protein